MRSNSRWSLLSGRWLVAGLAIVYVVSGFSRTFPIAGTVTAQQYTFEEVASGLKHQDPATRLRAIQILKDADYADAAVPIAANLADGDDRVQLAALDAERSLFTSRPVARRRKVGFVVEVRRIAGGDAAAEGQLALKPRAIPREVLGGLAAAVLDDNLRVRAEAIALTSLLAPAACAAQVRQKPDMPSSEPLCAAIGNALIENINTRQPVLRRASMQTLGQLRYPNAVQALSDQLSFHQKGADALAALEGLAGIGHSTSVSVFRQQLASSNAEMRRLAVEGLGRARATDALSELQQMGSGERSAGVLLALHYAHIKLGAPGTSVQELLAALGTAARRSHALRYLLDLAPEIAPALAEALRNQSPDVRRLAADLLGFSRDPTVVAALEAATKDPDPDVAQAAHQAIARLKL